jgi:hypothetical protein
MIRKREACEGIAQVQEAALVREAILRLLQERGMTKSLCPSEVARALANDETAWRALMPFIRAVAFDMRDAGEIRITQRGHDVENGPVRGPVRFALP